MSRGRWIDDPPNDAPGWREVWGEKKEYRGRVAPGLFGLITRAFEALLHPHVARQRDFNIVVTDLLRDMRLDLEALRRDFVSDRDSLRSEITTLHGKFPIVAARGDALVSALDRKIETLDSKLRDLALPRVTDPSPQFRDDWTYRRMEEKLRGSSEELREATEYYVDRAASNAPAIDLGCGSGEFLELCRERGIDARGIDSNERSVADLRERGLNVELGAVPDALRDLQDSSVGSLLASHVVEHMPFSPLVELFAQALRVLRPGGLFMIETPNAGSLAVAAGTIWNDPTHVAPRPAAAMVVIARELGFEVAELTTLRPFAETNRLPTPAGADPAMSELVSRLNSIIYGDQDLRLVLRKP